MLVFWRVYSLKLTETVPEKKAGTQKKTSSSNENFQEAMLVSEICIYEWWSDLFYSKKNWIHWIDLEIRE